LRCNDWLVKTAPVCLFVKSKTRSISWKIPHSKSSWAAVLSMWICWAYLYGRHLNQLVSRVGKIVPRRAFAAKYDITPHTFITNSHSRIIAETPNISFSKTSDARRHVEQTIKWHSVLQWLTYPCFPSCVDSVCSHACQFPLYAAGLTALLRVTALIWSEKIRLVEKNRLTRGSRASLTCRLA
jgi:hypothetical protein